MFEHHMNEPHESQEQRDQKAIRHWEQVLSDSEKSVEVAMAQLAYLHSLKEGGTRKSDQARGL